jgi:hypothetical protein
MTNIGGPGGQRNPFANKHHFFDRVNVRTPRSLKQSEVAFLRKHCNEAYPKLGWYIPGYVREVLHVVAPTQPAKEFLADLPPRSVINRLEPAMDVIGEHDTIWGLRDVCDNHFVQPWQGQHVQVRERGGTYTKQERAAFKFAWYADRRSKVTGEWCFHIEGRHIGVQAVRRAGVHHPRDMLTFDHEAYWQTWLRLYEIDLERLGRYHLNRQARERRQHPLLLKSRCGFVYNRDRSVGAALFRSFALHPRQHCRSVQQLVATYGRGPFLRPFQGNTLLNVNIKQSLLLKIPACSLDNLPVTEVKNVLNRDIPAIEMGTRVATT